MGNYIKNIYQLNINQKSNNYNIIKQQSKKKTFKSKINLLKFIY